MSNILDVFNPPPSGPATVATGSDCLPCTLVQATLAIGGGLYLFSGRPFQDAKGKVDLVKHPLWWQRLVRGALVVVVALGCYRLGEAAVIAYDKWEKRRPPRN